MKKYTENDIREHNRFYVGANTNRKKHGQAKPGTSRQQKISSRFSSIRHKEKDFMALGYIDIPYITKARLEALEHHVKANLVDLGFKHTGNDHFEFDFNPRFSVKDNYVIFCGCALSFAIAYCERYNLPYTLTWLA